MLSSILSHFWGDSGKEEPSVDNQQILTRTSVREESGDWLLISCESSSPDTNDSECDMDSVHSDSSWVITPAPTFQHSSGATHSNETPHPLEDLLIEHPTMSIYHHNSENDKDAANDNDDEENTEEDWNQNQELIQNQNRELVVRQNRQRQQLAAYLQIPLARSALGGPPKGVKHSKVTRKATKRHNSASRLNMKRQVQKCGFKAGRRRC